MNTNSFIKSEEGMTTVEYAVGTVAAASLGGILLKMLSSQDVQDLLWKIFQQAFSAIFGL
jgi:Flp pilus assembly pilin Flp